mgnify:FL=1
MQALERIHPDHPMKPGRPEQHEFEYTRHGTQCLIGNFEVATGKMINATVGDTRTEDDFVAHIKATVETAPNDQWVFVMDQLNTHKSAGLVEYIAKACEINAPLGIKGREGILHNMKSRAEFLQDPQHRIRIVYTPKHCSWLNQIEIWFGILSKRLLKRGSFSSTEQLRQKVLDFIDYFNEHLAKPFRWTYIGKPLVV